MNYFTEDKKIVIEDLSDFKISHILDCGQVFRYRNDGDCYTLFAKNKNCLLRKENTRVIIETSDVEHFVDYFDLKRDYSAIKSKLKQYDNMSQAVEFGKGIRILNQDPYEMIISFIISANNNIPRIKKIIERLCASLGEDMGGYFSFPTPEAMAEADKEFFASIGAGYRADYLYHTSKALLDFDFDEIRRADTEVARKKLMSLKGVGKKVADCILLFAFHKTDLFPMDTWSKKIYLSLGFPEDDDIGRMEKRLVDRFGTLSGFAQQYLYYYYRENKLS